MQGIRLNKHNKSIKVVNRRENLKLQHSGRIGPAGQVVVGETHSLPAGDDAYVVNTGTLQQAILEFFIPKGDKGDKGDTGVSTFVRKHHGMDANAARPDAIFVEWVGNVAPLNATTEDTWIDTIVV